MKTQSELGTPTIQAIGLGLSTVETNATPAVQRQRPDCETEIKGAVDCAGGFRPHPEVQADKLDVLLFDPVAGRRDALSQIIVAAGGTARVVELCGLEHVTQSATAARCIALVALANLLKPSDPVLELIANLTKDGCAVIAFDERLQHWSLRAKCLPLSAGAIQVLDSGSADFPRRLSFLLDKAFQAAEGRISDQAVQSLMRQQGMVGKSPAMLAVFRKTIDYARAGSRQVLLTGESGTGKELLARAIHQLGPKRKQGLFVPVNCAAINPLLAESEFFGHCRGAFTGADRDAKGWIRAADGGVLFLDEIGELELGLQAKLLRVLQENAVLPVGDEREVPVDVRFVAATNRDLQIMVAEGKFRGDLFHRLCAVLIQIPPLRERPSDLASLIGYFVQKHGKTDPPPAISADFVEALRQLRLPGNAREVENLVCEALVLYQGDGELGLNDLPM